MFEPRSSPVGSSPTKYKNKWVRVKVDLPPPLPSSLWEISLQVDQFFYENGIIPPPTSPKKVMKYIQNKVVQNHILYRFIPQPNNLKFDHPLHINFTPRKWVKSSFLKQLLCLLMSLSISLSFWAHIINNSYFDDLLNFITINTKVIPDTKFWTQNN